MRDPLIAPWLGVSVAFVLLGAALFGLAMFFMTLGVLSLLALADWKR